MSAYCLIVLALAALTFIGANPTAPTLPPFIRDHSWNDAFCDIDSVVPTNVISSFYEASTDFAYNLFKIATKEKSNNDNIVYSPTSIWLALGMLMQGASGETLLTMRTHLAPLLNIGLEDYDEDDKAKWMRALYHNIMSDMNQKRSGGDFVAANYQISSANRLYLRKGFTPVPTFSEAMTKCFLAGAQEVDFSKAADAAKTINDWVKGQTNNKITNLVGEASLSPPPAMVLVNAIYFKAEWARPFLTENGGQTRKMDFTQGNGQKKQVDFMTMTGEFLYKEDDDAQMLGIPYKDDEVIMFVFLPKEGKTIDAYVDGAGRREKLIRQMSEGTKQQVVVSMPKFKSEATFPLTEALKKAGLEQLFSDDANLAGISTNEALKVSEVIHKAFIEVNEKGTEAAAVTAILIAPDSALLNPPPDFTADRPFLFAIQHQANIDVFEAGVTSDKDAVKRVSKQLIFFGRISNP